MTWRLTAAIAAILLLGGCLSHSEPEAEPTYEPVPDATLAQRISSLPEVRSGGVDYGEEFGSTGYSGTLQLRPGADPAAVIDQVVAILWQGRPDQGTYAIEVVADGRSVMPLDVGLSLPEDYRKRYGPQPGTGEPPADAPPLQVQD